MDEKTMTVSQLRERLIDKATVDPEFGMSVLPYRPNGPLAAPGRQ